MFRFFEIYFSTTIAFVTSSAVLRMCQLGAPLHFVISHVLVSCDRPGTTVLMTANNDLCDIQQGLFGKLEILSFIGP